MTEDNEFEPVTADVEQIEALVRDNRGNDSFSFSPIAQELASGELEDGEAVTVEWTPLRDDATGGDLKVQFGKLQESVEVFIDMSEVIAVASVIAQENGYLNDGGDDE